eukprot:TRINITY_DN59114_c0_g1_i1.p1 TRINITY_DN59114_c0_g1~~TRINITY_DN59114_c0_g1_i1.p1  ORF type:complete len:615 (-),score=88.55 TRINITY_DN59114_c0_g1_i1:103-1947(-)
MEITEKESLLRHVIRSELSGIESTVQSIQEMLRTAARNSDGNRTPSPFRYSWHNEYHDTPSPRWKSRARKKEPSKYRVSIKSEPEKQDGDGVSLSYAQPDMMEDPAMMLGVVPGSLPADAEKSQGSGSETSNKEVPSAQDSALDRQTSDFGRLTSVRSDWTERDNDVMTFPNELRLPIGCTVGSTSQRKRSSLRGSSHFGDPSTTPGQGSVLPMASSIDGSLQTALPLEGLQAVLEHPMWDALILCVILLNGITIGVQTEYMARSTSEDVPVPLQVAEVVFCVFFTVELALRLWMEQKIFFVGPDMYWNIFDFLVVGLQILEEAMQLASIASGSQHHRSTNFSVMRILRVLRLLRIIRVVRVIRFLGELRTIVTSIASSMMHLLWTVVLLLIMIYTLSVYLTQIVVDYKIDQDSSGQLSELENWNNIGRSSLTLFATITGGLDWDSVVAPLMTHISPFIAPAFCGYIAFATLALMNVVTGVFVENAIESANRYKEKHWVQTAWDVFEAADPLHTGVVTWEKFQKQLEKPELSSYLKGLGVDAKSARGLFKILDIDNAGHINANELLIGTLRLRGQAKAIDLAALLYETRRMSKRMAKQEKAVEETLSKVALLLK